MLKQHVLINRLLKTPRYFNAVRTYTAENPQVHPRPQTKNKIQPFFEQHDWQIVLPTFKRVPNHWDKIALIDSSGKYDYHGLVTEARSLSNVINAALNHKTGERITFLCSNDVSYVVALWAIWMSGNIAVPLTPSYPKEMFEYYISDCQSKFILTTPQHTALLESIAKQSNISMHVMNESFQHAVDSEEYVPDIKFNASDLGLPNEFYSDANGLILYTSGTTGKPKGVVLSHKNIHAQAVSMIKAWKWSGKDTILHTLPLNHTHGLVNALITCQYVGAKCVMLPQFNAKQVWSHLLGFNASSDDRITLYTGVPTIYTKLISEYNNLFTEDEKMAKHVKQTLTKRIRLMLSGSAPLPIPVFNRWLEITGHRLLERYGMTEIGMALSNLYEKDFVKVSGVALPDNAPLVREPGCVGLPIPGVQVQIAKRTDDDNLERLIECHGPSLQDNQVSFKLLDKQHEKTKEPISGDLLVKGENVFKQYYNRPADTAKEFTKDGWFRTGDTVEYDPKVGLFKILGRTSVDIIKTGGFKVSAVFIETVLLAHPNIKEVAIVGLPDETWGEKIAAVIVWNNEAETTELTDLRDWCADKMPKYCLPSELRMLAEIPRNAMGKVNKKLLVKDVFETK